MLRWRSGRNNRKKLPSLYKNRKPDSFPVGVSDTSWNVSTEGIDLDFLEDLFQSDSDGLDNDGGCTSDDEAVPCVTDEDLDSHKIQSNIIDVLNAEGFTVYLMSSLGGEKDAAYSKTTVIRVAIILARTFQFANGKPLLQEGVIGWVEALISRRYTALDDCCQFLAGPKHLAPMTIVNYLEALRIFITFFLYFRRDDVPVSSYLLTET